MRDILSEIHKQKPVDTRYIAGRWHKNRISFRGLWIEWKVFSKSFITSTNKDIKKFLIIGRARSGTTLLTKLLSAHSQIDCHGEALNGYMISPAQHLHRLALKSQQSVFGAKLLSYQMVQIHRLKDPIGFLKNLRNDGFTFIHITRGTFAQTLSLAIAQKTENFHSDRGVKLKSQRTYYLEPEDFLQRIVWSDMLLQYERRIFEEIPHLDVSYEHDLVTKISQHQTIERLCEVFDVNSEITTSGLKKMLPSDPSEVIENYDEIIQTLRSSGYGHLIV